MPARNTAAPVVRRGWADAVLNHLTGSDTTSLAGTVTLHLLGAGAAGLTPDTPLVTLTGAEAAFSGYAADTVTLSGPVHVGTATEQLISDGIFIGSSTGTFTADTVTGYWVQLGTNWITAELFPPGQSVNFGSNGDWLDLGVAVPIALLPPMT